MKKLWARFVGLFGLVTAGDCAILIGHERGRADSVKAQLAKAKEQIREALTLGEKLRQIQFEQVADRQMFRCEVTLDGRIFEDVFRHGSENGMIDHYVDMLAYEIRAAIINGNHWRQMKARQQCPESPLGCRP